MNSSLKTRRFPRDQWRSIIAEKKKDFSESILFNS